jgi:hypothetical protein
VKLLKYFFYFVIAIFLIVACCIGLYFYSATDTNNAELSGLVTDSATNKPLNGALVIIDNWRYTSDDGKQNYDEYFGHDTLTARTNSKGYFYLKLKKSAFFSINVKHSGYKRNPKNGNYTSKKMHFTIRLDKN